MSTEPTVGDPKQVTDLVSHILSLRCAGQEPEIRELCGGDSALEREVRRQLECADTLTRLSQAGTKDAEETPSHVELSERFRGTKIDRYELRRLLGMGGFGQVWLAYDTDLRREVALKIPRSDRRFNEARLSLFLEEARKAASLDDHPGIVRVRDFQRRGDLCYIVSDHIDGTSLMDRLAEGALPPEESASVAAQVAEALHHAHLRGMVHRDVKPANILLDQRGRAYLTDFGLAVMEEEQLRETPGVRGTVRYMSPEQARGESHLVDARSDVYSLGVVLYQMLTGRHLFLAQDTEEYLRLIREGEPRPLRSITDDLPQELERICLRCLRKPREERYQTAKDLAEDLRRWLRPTRWKSWWMMVGGIITLVILLLSLVRLNKRPEGGAPSGREPVLAPRHFEWEREALEPNRWHSLLRWEPKPLHFPNPPQWNPGRAYWMNAERNNGGLIRFGEVGKPARYKLRVTFRSANWEETFSIFWGLHQRESTRQKGLALIWYQALKLDPSPPTSTMLVKHEYASDIHVDQPGRAPIARTLKTARAPCRMNQACTVELTIEPQGLRSVLWKQGDNEVRLGLGTPQGNLKLWNDSPKYFYGPLGVHLPTGTLRISEFEIMLLE